MSPALQADSLVTELLGKVKVKWKWSRSIVSNSLQPHGVYSLSGSSVHGIFPGKGTGVGCQFLLQGIFPTQGLNPGLLHCGQALYPLSHQGSRATTEAPLKYSLRRSCLWPFVLVLPAPLWGSSESGPFSPDCQSQAVHFTNCGENYAFLCFLHLSCWWDPV